TARVVTWASSNPTVATVSATGLVTAVQANAHQVMITATSETVSGSAGITVTAPEPTVSFATVEAGAYHTCGRTTAGAAYCWGDNGAAQLGIGALSPAITTTLQAVRGSRTLTSVSVGGIHACGLTAGGAARFTVPAAGGGVGFATVGAGAYHTCGRTTGGAAYCWGDNSTGELGIGVNVAPDTCAIGPCSRTPVAVAGGLTFTALNVGTQHTCARATDGSWYCWGLNNYGQLGTGATGPETCAGAACSSRPVAVSAGINLTAVVAGRRHSCGVTSAGTAYCWGENVSGQLGDGTTTNSLTPVAVAGGLTFATLSPFISHTCGLTTGGVGYCWGSNSHGELGDRPPTSRTVAVRVAGQPGAAAATSRHDAVRQRTKSEPAAVLRMLPP